MKNRVIGVMGAMPEEVAGVVQILKDRRETTLGKRKYYSGRINDLEVVVVFSRWGKVAAASTVSALIHKFGVNEIVFTGLAGSVSDNVRVGDVVVGSRLFQHDMDARPLIKRFELPLLGKTFIETRSEEIERGVRAITSLLNSGRLKTVIGDETLAEFNIHNPKVLTGDIASGDQFISNERLKLELKIELPELLCVEMEGASVAQVCFEYEVPFTIIRIISDSANDGAVFDFSKFTKKVAIKYSLEIVKALLNNV